MTRPLDFDSWGAAKRRIQWTRPQSVPVLDKLDWPLWNVDGIKGNLDEVALVFERSSDSLEAKGESGSDAKIW